MVWWLVEPNNYTTGPSKLTCASTWAGIWDCGFLGYCTDSWRQHFPSLTHCRIFDGQASHCILPPPPPPSSSWSWQCPIIQPYLCGVALTDLHVVHMYKLHCLTDFTHQHSQHIARAVTHSSPRTASPREMTAAPVVVVIAILITGQLIQRLVGGVLHRRLQLHLILAFLPDKCRRSAQMSSKTRSGHIRSGQGRIGLGQSTPSQIKSDLTGCGSRGGGGGMTPWCVLACSWRRQLANRHLLPFHRWWYPCHVMSWSARAIVRWPAQWASIGRTSGRYTHTHSDGMGPR